MTSGIQIFKPINRAFLKNQLKRIINEYNGYQWKLNGIIDDVINDTIKSIESHCELPMRLKIDNEYSSAVYPILLRYHNNEIDEATTIREIQNKITSILNET